MSVATLFSSGNLVDTGYDIFCDTLTANNISSSSTNISNITAGSVSVSGTTSSTTGYIFGDVIRSNYFLGNQKVVFASIDYNLGTEPDVVFGGSVMCNSIPGLHLALPNLSTSNSVGSKLKQGDTFNFYVTNNSQSGTILFSNSSSGNFIIGSGAVLPQVSASYVSGQVTRVIHCQVNNNDISASGAIVIY